MKKNYTVIHCHTELSLLDSCTNYKLYVDKAVELGQKAICFTEHGNIFNWIEKKCYCEEKGIKYMHGIECYLTETLDEKIRDNYHTILIAKNIEGFKELNLLVDKSTMESHFYYKPRISFDEFLHISDNIIKISACLASPLHNYQGKMFEELCKKYDYYEIQPHNCIEQIEYNKKLYNLSLKYNKPLIVGTDTHSLNSYKAECRKILKKAKKMEYANEDDFDLTYKSYDELVNMFINQNSLPSQIFLQAIENTNLIANLVETFELDKTFKYPRLYDDEESALKKVIYKNLQYKYDHNIIDRDRIDIYKANIIEEFKVFKKINMIGFMLFMSELINWCWDNDIPVGFCRGSVGGSTIAYITGIIDVDPVKWNTVFSRFANEDRLEIGDIDVDIAPTQRILVYNHIIEKFTNMKTAYILAIGTISDKGTIDDIGRALGYPLDKVAQIKNEYDNDSEKTKKNYQELFYYFDGLLNTAVSQSMHPAGIVVAPLTLPDNYGTFWNDGKRILSINMEEVHEVSLVKYDILGLKNIGIIHDCCKLVGIKYPKAHEINWDDKEVWEDIISSPTGIFQFEGDYAFSLLKSFKPRCVDDMSLVNASLRPSGASYRDRLLARIPNKNPSPIIDELLKSNNGFLVYQEDVIKFLKDICGLSGGDADNVRRAIGRKQLDRLQKALPQILEGYCKMSPKPREIAEEEAKTFLKIIEDSSNYMFGYNHSTGYSMIGYLCGYLRYYYPEEFIASYLNNANNTDDIVNGTSLATIKHITVNNIKFGKSLSDYDVDKKNHAVYKGIASIKYCNSIIADELMTLYKTKHPKTFIELLDDIRDTSVNSRQLAILTGLNFFSDYGKNKYLLQVIDIYNKFRNCLQIKKSKLEELGLSNYLISRYSNKETEALYKEINNVGLINELIKSIPNKSMGIVEHIKFEKEYLEYITYINGDIKKEYWIIVDFKQYKDVTKPYFTARNINNGEEVKARITQGKIFVAQPFSLYSVLDIKKFNQKRKKKPNADGKWVETDELENILENYEVIKNEKYKE